MNTSPCFCQPEGGSTVEERRILALYNGSRFIEKIFEEFQRYLERHGADRDTELSNKVEHYSKCFFQKFYGNHDLEQYRYLDVALASCYLVLKIQDSKQTRSYEVGRFLKATQNVWMKYYSNTSLDDMIYILPRMECILFYGIDFDLRLNIPYKFIPMLCKKAFGLTPKVLDELYAKTKSTKGNSQNLSESIRYFLRFCLNSAICVDFRHDLVAATAVHYAINVTGMAERPEYHHGWECEVGLTKEVKDMILERRKQVSACVSNYKGYIETTSSPTTPRPIQQSRNEQIGGQKRTCQIEQQVESKRQHVYKDKYIPAPLMSVDIPAPLMSVDIPAPLMSIDIPAPLMSIDIPAPLEPAPLEPVPLMSVAVPAPLVPAPLTGTESITHQPAPLVSANPTSCQPSPLFVPIVHHGRRTESGFHQIKGTINGRKNEPFFDSYERSINDKELYVNAI